MYVGTGLVVWGGVRRAGVWAGVLAVVTAGTAAFAGTPRARVAEPGPDTAVVSVYAGGDRKTASTIAALPGVTFGLFATEPAGYDPLDGFATGTPLHTCVSDADGDCVFTVPVGAGGVAEGSRLWVAPTAGPAGWYANPVWQTAPADGTAGRMPTRHAFQTPPLYPGRGYASGSGGFLGDPGSETDPPSGVPRYTTRTASGGTWPLSRVDPDLPARCGLRVALVVDLSSSVAGFVDGVRGAADAFVDALRGTPSRAALFTFSTDSPAVDAGPNSGLMPVASTVDARAFRARYAGWTDATAGGLTNWDRALGAVAAANENPDPAERFDLAVLLTDGNPTAHGPQDAGYPPPAGHTRFREIGAAVASANRLKSQGTRIVAVGVGAGLDEGADRNLRAISGRTGYDGGGIQRADHLRLESYAAAGEALRDLVLSACARSVSVVKRVVPPGGTVADAYPPAEAWGFTATTTAGATDATTDARTGALTFAAASATGMDVTEEPGTGEGYTPFRVGGANAVCVDKSAGGAPVPVRNLGATGFHVEVGARGAVSCAVHSRAPGLDRASVSVGARWRVTTAAGTRTYADGEQPHDLQARLSLSGPGGSAASGQPWSVRRDGYAAGERVTLGEAPLVGLPGCALTGATIAGTGAPPGDLSAGVRLAAGANEYTVVNDVECHSNLTLTKRVIGGAADPSAWILEAVPPDGARAGPEGTSGVSAEVTDSVPYQLAERPASDDPALLDYRQDDFRPDPAAHPASTGSMACEVVGPVRPEGGYVAGVDGSVVVPMGFDVECVATDQTAPLTLVKRVLGGAARAADFTLTLNPVAPDPPGVRSRTVAGTAEPGVTVDLRPGQRYEIGEESVHGYTLTGLSCGLGGTSAAEPVVTIPQGAGATCTAVSTYDPRPAPAPAPAPPGRNPAGGPGGFTLTSGPRLAALVAGGLLLLLGGLQLAAVVRWRDRRTETS
ncbi:hypothetical protein RB614_27120 [Phytohabitans sp. ZYX-F-186]|uniref:VWFA domain-containing protein n=1 Tax=Phytohabitans maris TaxID=3071409 RepID=A0ABU0ZMD6_9ACTN|nr:hypothetical protein [Phytohabitans sp. ZYX-F-186]MDQ7908202.1 hypothetical protein [Phytohabitans sp. ZYX-F-186]